VILAAAIVCQAIVMMAGQRGDQRVARTAADRVEVIKRKREIQRQRDQR